MRLLATLACFLLFSVGSAGDWVGNFMNAIGSRYPTVKYIDYSDSSRWELSECEKFGTYLVGKFD